MVIFLSQTESTPKHFFLEKKALFVIEIMLQPAVSEACFYDASTKHYIINLP